MALRKHLLFILLLFATTGSAVQATGKDSLRLLFIGNSLTYSNDLPALLEELGKQDGKTISYTSLLYPNYSLEDHWNEGKAANEIETGNYDFVIMQQGPSAAPASQVLLLEFVTKFAELCKKANVRPVVYMVWPSKARSFDMDNVIRSHKNAAGRTNTVLAPAGLAWKYAWQQDETLTLYSEDDFHPSLMGTVLAAMTIYGSLTMKDNFSFIRYQKASWKNSISRNNFGILQGAAAKALRER